MTQQVGKSSYNRLQSSWFDLQRARWSVLEQDTEPITAPDAAPSVLEFVFEWVNETIFEIV